MCELKRYGKTSNTQIDRCMKSLIKFLEKQRYNVVACCCGHAKYPITVVVRTVTLCGKHIFEELFTGVTIPRTRRFYKRDIEGYYYIPETISK